MQDWIRDVPEYLGSLLTNIRALHFDHVDFEVLPIEHDFKRAFRGFSRIRMLKLTSCKFINFYDFENLVLAFPPLNALSIDMVSWRDDRTALAGEAHPQRTTFHLTSLQIGRYCSMSTIVPWLYQTRCIRSLKELELYVVDPGQISHVGSLLLGLGSVLEHLTLGCKFDRDPYAQRGEPYHVTRKVLLIS